MLAQEQSQDWEKKMKTARLSHCCSISMRWVWVLGWWLETVTLIRHRHPSTTPHSSTPGGGGGGHSASYQWTTRVRGVYPLAIHLVTVGLFQAESKYLDVDVSLAPSVTHLRHTHYYIPILLWRNIHMVTFPVCLKWLPHQWSGYSGADSVSCGGTPAGNGVTSIHMSPAVQLLHYDKQTDVKPEICFFQLFWIKHCLKYLWAHQCVCTHSISSSQMLQIGHAATCLFTIALQPSAWGPQPCWFSFYKSNQRLIHTCEARWM